MTFSRDEIMAMTAEELRVAIAKKKGYGWYEYKGCAYLTRDHYLLQKYDAKADMPNVPLKYAIDCPDYPNDIAAAYQLEESVPEGRDQGIYSATLEYVIEEEFERPIGSFDIAHATAEQRSRAYMIWSEESGKC